MALQSGQALSAGLQLAVALISDFEKAAAAAKASGASEPMAILSAVLGDASVASSALALIASL